jgi:deoxycytidylate deaminase
VKIISDVAKDLSLDDETANSPSQIQDDLHPEEDEKAELLRPKNREAFLNYAYKDTELVIGLVGAVGTKHKRIVEIITERLRAYNYIAEIVSVSKDVIMKMYEVDEFQSEFERIKTQMDLGNKARKDLDDNSILALGVAAEIVSRRKADGPSPRTCYIVSSLKHPKEVELLREIYSDGFFLFGVHSDEQSRLYNLTENLRIPTDDALDLIARDVSELEGHGQHTRDTFQMADFFVHLDRDHDQVEKSIWRILDLLFGQPFMTPTFEEYAMFMAFTSALRSADLSRQVGAVIAKNNEIIASGANDAPKSGGGLYWPMFDNKSNSIIDYPDGRDYTREIDSNKEEQAKIIEEIAQLLNLSQEDKGKLRNSPISDITEYGRVVHAEMEALLMCARNEVSTRGATLYGTTFPCHNCAKHIIAAGIEKVVYIEPYPKSKAFQFHTDSIVPYSIREENLDNKVIFQPFVGIGPRRFFELFSMSINSGNNKKRKDKLGKILPWIPESSNSRMQLLPYSYLEKEMVATAVYQEKWRNANVSN